MRLTKRQLKRIIREEYTRLKRRGLINEMGMVGDGMSMYRGGMCDGAAELIAIARDAFDESDGEGLMNYWSQVLRPFGPEAQSWLGSLETELDMGMGPQFNDEIFEEHFMQGVCRQEWCDALYGDM